MNLGIDGLRERKGAGVFTPALGGREGAEEINSVNRKRPASHRDRMELMNDEVLSKFHTHLLILINGRDYLTFQNFDNLIGEKVTKNLISWSISVRREKGTKILFRAERLGVCRRTFFLVLDLKVSPRNMIYNRRSRGYQGVLVPPKSWSERYSDRLLGFENG